MFIGHWAPALAAAAVSPRAPRLGALFVAAQLVDWAFFALALFGIEGMRVVPGHTAMNPLDFYHYPYTHSLAATGVWAVLFGLVIVIARRDLFAGIVGGLVVLSHWVLDFLVHAPDLTLAGGEQKFGLGLWNQPWIEMPLELAITGFAFAFYMRRTKGPVGPPLILAVLLLSMQAINWFGPEPVEASAGFYLTGLIAFGLVTAIAWWVGATRWHKSQVGLAVP